MFVDIRLSIRTTHKEKRHHTSTTDLVVATDPELKGGAFL